MSNSPDILKDFMIVTSLKEREREINSNSQETKENVSESDG